MTAQPYQKWICDACGFIYDEAKGDPDSGLAPGTRYADIPDGWQCPWCGLAKSDLRLLPEPVATATPAVRPAAPVGRPGGGPDTLVIIGAGVAGWSVAEAVRTRDAMQPVLLVTGCEGQVYPKPALSMALAQGKQADDLVEQDAASRAAELGIEVLTRTRVLKVDTARKRLVTARGGIAYGKLVLATGARQRELPLAGNGGDGVLRVNDLGTYRRLREALATGREHVTILGAGLIGCEFAEDLSGAGHRVTVVDPMSAPLAGLVPAAMAGELRARLAAKGVDWRLGTVLERLDRDEGAYRARLADGGVFATDVVVSAAGLVPNTDVARKAGLAIDGGIAVDANLCTSAPEVYAIGDCAAVAGRVYAYIEPIRRQAAAIAAHCCGNPAPFVALPPLVRVKTPSLPIAVCTTSRALPETWTLVSQGAEGWRMDHRLADGTVDGFALCGDLAGTGMTLYRELYAS